MSQTDMLRTVDEVIAARDRGDPAQVSRLDGSWSQPLSLESIDADVVRNDIASGFQFRIASPSRQAAPACDEATGLSEPHSGSQVVSDDDVRLFPQLPKPEAQLVHLGNRIADVYIRQQMIDYARASADALLARRPCAQGQGDGEFVIAPREATDAMVREAIDTIRRKYDCHEKHFVDAVVVREIYSHCLHARPAPQPAPAGASTPTAQAPVKELPAWPTRDQLREIAEEAIRNWHSGCGVTFASAIADRIHARLTAAGGRDGEGS